MYTVHCAPEPLRTESSGAKSGAVIDDVWFELAKWSHISDLLESSDEKYPHILPVGSQNA